MDLPPPAYREGTALLVKRLVALGPDILKLTDANPSDLFRLGLDTTDVEVTWAQAEHALLEAQDILRSRNPDPVETDGKDKTDE